MTAREVRSVVSPEPPARASGDARRRALFLDRDGVININHGYVHTPEHTDWVPGIFDLARAAHAAGLSLVVATNQAGIARGYYTEDQFREYTRWMHGEFARRGVPLLATYYCPHHPEAGLGASRAACECRKPRPGMLLAAAEDWNIELAQSAMLGDQLSDVAAAGEAGIGFAGLVRSNELSLSLGTIGRWFASGEGE